MHDGLTLEKKGTPTAVICTEPFTGTAKMMSKLLGIPEYPFVVVDHPLGSLTQEEIKDRAKIALPQILKILLG